MIFPFPEKVYSSLHFYSPFLKFEKAFETDENLIFRWKPIIFCLLSPFSTHTQKIKFDSPEDLLTVNHSVSLTIILHFPD